MKTKVLTVLKRILAYFLVLVGLSILIFVIVRIMPGDTARMALGPRAPEEAVEALREEMHLNDSYIVQYGHWIAGILEGDFGESIVTKRPVLDDIKSYLPATLELALITAVLIIVFGILLGVVSTKYSGKWLDGIIRTLSYFGICAPAFLWAVFAMLLFAYMLPILPISGRLSAGISPPAMVTGIYTIDFLLQGDVAGALDALKHLILPAVVMSFAGISQAARITRSSMVENLDKPYAYAERAYGIPENKVLHKYLLKPSLNSTISVMALDIAGIFGSAFLVEQIFGYPGLSNYGLTAMLNKDVFAVSAVVMVLGIIVIIFNLLADLVIRALDPRVRLQEK